jgi:hypothetical protein
MEMFSVLEKLIIDGKLKGPPMKKWSLNGYANAMACHMEGGNGKQLIILDSSMQMDKSKY